MSLSRTLKAVAMAAALLVAGLAPAQPATMDMARFVPHLLPSVVSITTKSMQKPAVAASNAAEAKSAQSDESFGTGFVIDPDGYIITNRHVVDNAYDIIVGFSDGTRLSATLVGKGRQYDLAVIKVNPVTPLKAVRLGDSDKMQVGDEVLAIGNPFGLGIAASAGIVSGLDRKLHFTDFDEFIQTDASINHGNSGGPLFNNQGEVIGINTALYSNNSGGGSVGIGYAIPSSDAKLLIPILKAHGYLRVGSLEVEAQPVTAALANALGVEAEGAILTTVDPAGPSATVLTSGDIIRKIGDDDVHLPRDVYRLAGPWLGQTLPVVIWRQGHLMTVTITPGQAPQEAGQPPKKMAAPIAQASESMRLGGTVAPLTPDNRHSFDIPPDRKGILVTNVEPGSPSAAAGLSVGDVIEAVQMEPVTTPTDGARIIDRAAKEGRQFIVALVRSSKDVRFVTVPLAAQ